MIGFILRIIVASAALGLNIYLFYIGSWGWGITMLFVTALVILSFFRNPTMILALNQMRIGNTDKAYKYINRVSSPQFLPRKQHAYVIFLQAIMGAQTLGIAQSEQKLRKALALGLRTPEDLSLIHI